MSIEPLAETRRSDRADGWRRVGVVLLSVLVVLLTYDIIVSRRTLSVAEDSLKVVNSDGRAGVYLLSSSELTLARFGRDLKNGPAIEILARDDVVELQVKNFQGMTVARLETTPDGGARIVLLNSKGERVWSAPP